MGVITDLIRAVRPKAEYVFYVSPNFHDNYQAHEFNTIQGAIDYIHDSSWYSDLHQRSKALINVHPGWYDEQIKCWDYIVINGYCNTDLRKYSGVTIDNTGVDRDHYPIAAGSDYVYEITGIDFRCDSGQTHTELGNMKFNNCLFYNGSIKENTTEDVYSSMSFKDCTFWDGAAFDVSGARVGTNNRYIWLEHCRLNGELKLKSTGTGSALVELENTTIAGANVDMAGNWSFDAQRSHIYDNVDGTRNNFNTPTGYIHFYNSTMSNGIHFQQDTSGDKVIHNCDFNDSIGNLIIGADITSDVIIPIVDYVQNIQQHGIDGKIQTIFPVKNFGGNSLNKYISIQDAIDSIPVNSSGSIYLYESASNLSQLVITGSKEITFEGSFTYEMNFTSNIASLVSGQSIIFNQMGYVRGYTFEINGAGASLIIENCLTTRFNIVCTSGVGSLVVIYGSTHYGRPTYPAVAMNNTDTLVVGVLSFIEGGSGTHPAIFLSVDADLKIKLKYSTLNNSGLGANAPLIYSGAGSVDISVYQCALNAVWDPSDFNNTIVSAGNVNDSSIDF